MEDWLASIGLASYAQMLRQRVGTLAELCRLTEQDLRQIGLAPDACRRLLSAARAATEPAQAVAERRPLSMMFVDLVGSSRLAEMMVPEDLMELIRRYGNFCDRQIARYGGRITRMVGDGILACFCYPIANENDPERAVRAALEVARGVGEVEVPGGERMAVRIGIATGRVVLGDLTTAGGVHRSTIIGSAPNIAARLQHLAPPGGVVVAEETYSRVRDRFVCAELGSLALHGIAQPHRCWEVVREVATYARVPRRRQGVLVGRDADLAVLNAAWARACAGHGGVVVVSGEPGIGKSHLVETFLASSTGVPGMAPRTVLLEGVALENESPLRPVVAWLHRTASAANSDPEAEISSRLNTALKDWTVHAPDLAPVLAAPDPARGAAPVSANPEQLREARLAALTNLLLAQAAERPLRLVVEDLHWFDPTSLELVLRLAGKLSGHPVLMVLTARDGFDVDAALGWGRRPANVTELRLLRLGDAEVTALAAQMLPDGVLPEAWLRIIRRKADGVPLFVGEMVRELAARGEPGAADSALAESMIPASIHELLAGRLDRLGEAKQIAQAASVIGADLRHEVLARVCAAQFGTTPAALDAALATLVQAGVLTESSDARRASVFVHALLQDAAYHSLLRERRQALHGHTARALLAAEPDVAIRRPELIAQHLEAAAEAPEAVPHWLQAGRASLASSALREASHHLERGLATLDAMPQTDEVKERKLEFMALLGPALMAAKGFGSPEAAQLYAAANALCQELPESPRNFPIYWGWWRVTRDNARRQERAYTLRDRARQRRDPELQLQAFHCSWASDFFVGSYGQSCEHAAAGLAIYDQHDFRHHAHIYGGHDAKVCGHGNLALCHWIMGRPVSARREDQRSFAWAETLGQLGSRLHNRENRLYRLAWSGDLERLAAEARELLQVAEQHGMEDLRAKGLIFLGYSVAREVDPAAGLAMLEDGWQRQCEIGTNEDFPVYVTMLAEALIAGGKPERALDELRRAETEFDATGLRFWRSEVRRMEAQAVLAAGGSAREETCEQAVWLFDNALNIAEQQGATMLALRAATGLARVDPGPAALRQLQRSLAAIAEDAGGPDFAAARALLPPVRPEVQPELLS